MRTSSVAVGGVDVPVTGVSTVIVGAGAAGMGCAVQLVRRLRAAGVERAHEQVCVVTGGLHLGASRMSGSDKQTYYKMGTSPRVADSAADFAGALTAFGCCHGDTALVEGLCSLRGFYNLVELGVPFPRDPWGAFVGYKTDHDPYERATSAGPKTSRFMSECLQREAEREGVKIFDNLPVARLLTTGEGDERRIVALACTDRSRVSGDDPGLHVFLAENWVLAAGGPGEIYKDTVYPPGQYGIHGAALEAGLVACNLTESQYGLASTKFRWNVSGTYMQAIPRIFSTDATGGDPREFLSEYFDDMPSMATNIFLKGYQWPFDAQRIAGGGSSLIDMAVHQETIVRGRRVWMDFLTNPIAAAGWSEFRIDDLGPEAQEYLRKTGAVQAAPIERLRHMNPPAIEIYADSGIDLAAEPLEIAVCAQHNNGGFAVDKWWRSSVAGVFVIGEMAGTHGVKRPGGSALNAGQAGAMRCAEYIAAARGAGEPDISATAPGVSKALAGLFQDLKDLRAKAASAPQSCDEAMEEIRVRMTTAGAHLRSRAGAAKALGEATDQYARLASDGIATSTDGRLDKVLLVLQQCLTQIAMLKAICAMFDRGAGSRGSHCILDPAGVEMHPALIDPQTHAAYRFLPENEKLRDQILHVRYNADEKYLFDAWDEAPRPIPDRRIAFEPAWAEFREGKIYDA